MHLRILVKFSEPFWNAAPPWNVLDVNKMSAHEQLDKTIRKYRKKLRQIENLERAERELTDDEIEKVFILKSQIVIEFEGEFLGLKVRVHVIQFDN